MFFSESAQSFPTQLASPPLLRQAIVEFSYHHHISASGRSAFGRSASGRSAFGRFFSLSLAYSISGLDPSSSAGETVVTGPIPSLDRSVGISVIF